VQLTATVAEHIARAIEWSRHHPRSAGKRALQDREQRQDRSYDAYATTSWTTPCRHFIGSRSSRSRNDN